MTRWASADADVLTDNSIEQLRPMIPFSGLMGRFKFKNMKTGQRLDTYDTMPDGMREYLSRNGWHFSKKLCDWAVSRMKVKDIATGKDKRLEPMTKDSVDELLKKYGVKIDNDKGYDCVYVANMGKADYMKSSIADDQHLALFVKDYLDDTDGYDGLPLTRFMADCIGSGTPITWLEVL